MSSNFLVFDENNVNIESDGDYSTSTQRLNGVAPGIALSDMHNKLFRQTSIMCAAIGEFISNAGLVASDVSLPALVTAFTDAVKSVGATTGDIKPSLQSSLGGWVLCNGQTIGNASSNATSRANSDCQTLFALIWNQTASSNIPIFTSAGVLTTRGVSASADWTANKQIQIPDLRGRAIIGLDNMGGAGTAGRVSANASSGSMDANAMCIAGGQNAHTQTQNELVSHTHTVNSSEGYSSHGAMPAVNGYTVPNVWPTTQATGGGLPFNVMQPSMAVNIFIKL